MCSKGNYCKGCPYLKNKSKRIDGINMDKKVLLVLQSPGKEENKHNKPLASTDNRSATVYISNALPVGKTLDDYAIVELVRCMPPKESIDKIALSICYRYLEDDISNHDYEKVICLCADSIGIVENIKKRTNKTFKIVKGAYPSPRTISSRKLERILK